MDNFSSQQNHYHSSYSGPRSRRSSRRRGRNPFPLLLLAAVFLVLSAGIVFGGRKLRQDLAVAEAAPAGVATEVEAGNPKGPGVSARLTKSDAVILNRLALRRGEIVSHDDLLAALHDGDCAGEVAAVRAAVGRLKDKLGRAGACITTERGFGYRLLA